jgi:hypothetical protein
MESEMPEWLMATGGLAIWRSGEKIVDFLPAFRQFR